MGRISSFFVIAALLFGFSFAQGVAGVANTVGDLCAGVKGILPVAAMLMVVLAGAIYAAGQVMGAETRARANVWATAALTGALISVLIVVIAPPVLSAIYPDAAGGCAGCSGAANAQCGGNTNVCCAGGYACVGAQGDTPGACTCTAMGSAVVAGVPCCAGSHSDGNNCVQNAGPAPQCIIDADCNDANLVCQGGQCVQREQENLVCGGNDCGVPIGGNACCGNGCPCAGERICAAGACRDAGNGEYGDACGAAEDEECGIGGELYSCNNAAGGSFCGGNGQRTATCGGGIDLQCIGNLASCNNIGGANECGGNGQLGAACGGTSDVVCADGNNCVGGVCTAVCIEFQQGICQQNADCCQGQARAVVCRPNGMCDLCYNRAALGCSLNSQCCSNDVCVPAGAGALKWCQSPNRPNGQRCDENVDCLSNNCVTGICQPGAGA